MDPHSLRVLEFDRVQAALAQYIASAIGRSHVDTLQPSTSPDQIKARLVETSEARRYLDEEGRFPLGGIGDCDAILKTAATGGVLQPDELIELADTLGSLWRLRTALTRSSNDYPILTRLADPIGNFSGIVASIRHCISERGELLDRASPELGRIRSAIGVIRSRLTQRLEGVLRSPAYRLMIQDPVLVQRAGRTCVPVKVEYRVQFPGIVHDQSASGQTVFMEPLESVEIGNEIRGLELEVQAEIHRILQKLSVEVASFAPGIRSSLERSGVLDFIHARALYSQETDAVAPHFSSDGSLLLVRARHPLLNRDAVPLDLEMDSSRRTLVITGPNTGGKTVALKTTGLLCLMAQSGLHVPAEKGTRLPFFSAVFADIGDEQSIAQNLSTFSSHIRQIVRTVVNLVPGSLVLLDELGAGTDPVEGAALAQTLIECFTEKNARTIVTTHYGELKEFAYRTEGVENASMEFDAESLRPTYRLQMGVPGRSLALVIADRLGMPDEIVVRARSRVPQEERSAWEMLRQLEIDRREAEEARTRAERDAAVAETLRTRRERELADLDRRRKEILDRAAAQAQDAVREGQEQVKAILADLRKQASSAPRPHEATESLARMHRDLGSVRDRIASEMARPRLHDFEPSVGASVRVRRFNQQGTVLEKGPGDDYTVAVGSMKVKVPADELEPGGAIPRSLKRDPIHTLRQQKVAEIGPEIKLIGMRAEQAVHELDRYLDDAYVAGLPRVRVIHGKGTGALKKAVWDWLNGRHGVKSYRLGEDGEGGAGATVVELSQ